MENKFKSFSNSLVREDGILRVGRKVKLACDSASFNKIYGENLKNEEVYTISSIQSQNGINNCFIILDEVPDKLFPPELFTLIPETYNVYRWKKHYILSTSISQAQNIWDTWIDKLKIEAGENKPKLFKIVNNLENLQETDLFPKRIGMTCEYTYPCILKNLEWNDDSVLFVYRGR